MIWRRWLMVLLVVAGMSQGWSSPLEAHRAGCHRWHSCPSDRGTYTCGDLGYCSQCPENDYCAGGHPRTAVQKPRHHPRSPTAEAPTAAVKRVIDGDTVELTTSEKVRLIGVDTPETKDPRKPVQYFGTEATAFTKRLVEGKRVRLEYDQQRQDKYGRTLAYVYLEDGTFVNAEIIRQGYGFAYTRFPFTYLEQFRQLEREAREAKRGLWEAK
jgi:micrococcal nuclease